MENIQCIDIDSDSDSGKSTKIDKNHNVHQNMHNEIMPLSTSYSTTDNSHHMAVTQNCKKEIESNYTFYNLKIISKML